MESRLQSNEVRIPKTTVISSATTNGVLSSSNITMSSPSVKRNENNSIKTSPSSAIDFDLNSPCQYFKSSFARSLSMHTGSNQTKSLDFGINFGLSRTSPIREEAQTPVSFGNGSNKSIDGVFNGDDAPPPPLPLSQPPPLINGSTNNHSNASSITSTANSSSNNNNSNARNVWSNSHKQNLYRRSLDSTEIEVLRLRKECQNLIEENRRLMSLASGIVGGNLVVPGNSPNIEAVILQTQVDTLQWQLKQVEASRQMYRAVMEEVIRFLERCHRNLDSMQNEQIARSKSIHHVYRNDIIMTNSECNNPTSPRARSSTNLMDVQKTACPNKFNEDTTSNSSPAASYNNFRDFTWRRSPKRAASAQLATSECDPEKLAQEAFRLLRTAQNLLNTQEPDLTQPKHIIEFQYNNSPLSSSAQTTKPTSSSPAPKPKSSCHQLDSDSFCLTFSRKMNMRESRLSLRSSTDGSVHSTSSSKNETDEENQSPPMCKETTIACSTTEDESGFSSISSFQEVGLPLHSTMISSPIPTINSSTSDDSGESNTDICVDSRNSTLKANPKAQTMMMMMMTPRPPPPITTTTATVTTGSTTTSSSSSLTSATSSLVSNNIGLPLTHNHRRWDSAPAVPPRTNLHRFSTLPADDTPTVLWV